MGLATHHGAQRIISAAAYGIVGRPIMSNQGQQQNDAQVLVAPFEDCLEPKVAMAKNGRTCATKLAFGVKEPLEGIR